MSNPVKYVDPSGYVFCDPSKDSSIECAEKVIDYYAGTEVIPDFGNLKTAYRTGSGLEALARLFTEPQLDKYASGSSLVLGSSGSARYYERINPPTGTTAKDRLRFIITFNTDYEARWRDQFGQGRINFGDSGLRCEFQDRLLVGGPDNAIGRHLMLAIRMGFENSPTYWAPLQVAGGVTGDSYEEIAIRFIVGHEVGVFEGSSERDEAQATTALDVADFRQALLSDRNSNFGARDALLQGIFDRHDVIRAQAGLPSLADEAWRGGTFPDLLLSLKGLRFGQEIRNGTILTRYQAAHWLRVHLGYSGGGGTTLTK